ncbi:hypothetical protein CPAR01_01824 [Colletotrichum paranaense]|uniref:Dockerin type 1 n=1 Tax=Colletotrichum paranaense TaxID=1914294 RepID=A0ABQ9T7V0_9PEZI|nr:uncharacterized protein CPAR01_01824 [Colletotrichum paranaense]KAK1547857.1 hypothetical protein CPAR01_01824 [Colletotrichum paranaense]
MSLIEVHRLQTPVVTVLGRDPAHRKCVLNGNAFQQDAIISFRGWQYAVFYSSCSSSSLNDDTQREPLFVCMNRRKLPNSEWQTIIFDDYRQTTDDGHNTVQMGICPGDGTIHLSYDHHCDTFPSLKYRRSIKGIASDPELSRWTKDVFTLSLDYVPGITKPHENFGYVTYPRFGVLGNDMYFSIRNGKAGLGDDLLYIYRAATGLYEYAGKHLKGIQNNPYVHGMDYRDGKLHITWVYRGFVHYDGWDDPLDTKHKQQAGPNGADNNYNICYAYSDDGGYTWKNGHDKTIALLRDGGSITPDCPGLVAFDIPKGRGLTNQEAQAVDQDGQWTQHAIGPVPSPRRGRLAISKTGDLFLILPDPTNSSLRILKSSKAKDYAESVEVWRGVGFMGEPLVDSKRLEEEDVLSIFAIAVSATSSKDRQVVVLDFQI